MSAGLPAILEDVPAITTGVLAIIAGFIYRLRAQPLESGKRSIALEEAHLRMVRSVNQRKPLTGRVLRSIIKIWVDKQLWEFTLVLYCT